MSIYFDWKSQSCNYIGMEIKYRYKNVIKAPINNFYFHLSENIPKCKYKVIS